MPAAQTPNARDALARFPKLLVGPLLFGVIHKELSASQLPLDLEGLFAAYLQILFPQPPCSQGLLCSAFLPACCVRRPLSEEPRMATALAWRSL